MRLDFTFFGGSTDEVLADVTMRWLPQWGTSLIQDVVAQFKRTKTAGVGRVLLTPNCYDQSISPVRYRGTTVATRNVRTVFAFLKAYGLLDMVKVLYPIDEPEASFNNVSEADIIQCNADLNAVCAEYPELSQVKLAVIYGNEEDYRGLASYNGPGGGLIGADAYGQGTDILSGIYARLEPMLSPSQSLIVVPGGANPWRQDPAPFYAWAQQHRVGLFCPFIMDSHWGGTQNLGIIDNGMHPAYAAVAAAIKADNAKLQALPR